MNDIRFALRQLRKTPGFTIIAASPSPLGLELTPRSSASFTRCFCGRSRIRPHRIMALHETNGTQDFSLAFPDYVDWRRDSTVFEHLALSRRDSRNLTMAGREPERIGVAFVTANFFNVIGLQAQHGRTFTEEEDRVGGPQLVVISDRLWQAFSIATQRSSCTAVTFFNQPVTVIGVMPPAMAAPQDADAWFPIMRRTNNPAWQNRANHPMMFAWGRLKPGRTVEEARAEMQTISARLAQQYPDTNAGVSAVVKPLLENLVGGYRKNLTLLLGAVGLVLLIACAISPISSPRAAPPVRASLPFARRWGASRARIVRQLLVESAAIALVGGGLGYLCAVWSRDAMTALAPAGIARFQEVNFDVRILAFTFGRLPWTTVLFGLAAFGASRADVQLALKSGSGQSTDSRAARRSRDWLVIGEIALTVVLHSSAALVMKSFARAQALSLGYEPRDLLTARIDLPSSFYRSLEEVQTFSNAFLKGCGHCRV